MKWLMSLYLYVQMNGYYYTSMEYGGINLRRWCADQRRRGGVSLEAVKKHIGKVLQALVYLHARGYIHGFSFYTNKDILNTTTKQNILLKNYCGLIF